MLPPAEGETRAAAAVRSDSAGRVPPRRAVLGRAARGLCGRPRRGTGRTWRRWRGRPAAPPRLLPRYRCPGPAGAQGRRRTGLLAAEAGAGGRRGGRSEPWCRSVRMSELLSIRMGCGETERCPQRWPRTRAQLGLSMLLPPL